ncbi:hypothetical protein FCV43_17525 [Vibrio genomosp. F6]|uniref:hypothetical protein n=1 Tax=Vibrio TaxID=662 RepID=UPI0010BD5604|nr:hypothetical protein [Vibrio genomosp. F6]TKF17345.1 hypothetical protein FCV43_17525 [Vibrio genomosp. F6]
MSSRRLLKNINVLDLLGLMSSFPLYFLWLNPRKSKPSLNRAKRRLVGKSDTIDAENAARSVLAKESTAIPKSHDGKVEALRYFMVVRRST